MILDNYVCVRGDAWNQMVAVIKDLEERIDRVRVHNERLDRLPRGVDYRLVCQILGVV